MTIDSGWVRVFKEQVAPNAFCKACPFKPKVAYIDGMPLLMIAEARVNEWSQFLSNNFVRTVVRYFRLGCEAVVLAFDDYDHVPKAKAITQANRAKQAKEVYDFAEGSQLPATIPPKYNEKLTNRIFKRRVIDMICNCIMDHLSHLPLQKEDAKLFERKFVLDYSGCPIQFTCPADGSLNFDRKPTFLTDLPPLGEADIKYLRWADFFQGDILAYSVDGDFIPIALIRHEMALASATLPVHKVALYRMQYNAPGSKKQQKPEKQQLQLAGRKRKGDGKMVLATTKPAEGTSSKGPRREYEYVDISALYAKLRSTLMDSCPRAEVALAHERSAYFMRMLAVLIGLSGTDFSRNLPHLSPVTVWSMLTEDAKVYSAWLCCYDARANSVRLDDACDSLAASIYLHKFSSHFFGRRPASQQKGATGLRAVLLQLRDSSRLADRTKAQLPSFERVETTFKNISWLLQYWMCRPPGHAENKEGGWDHSACYPDPISPEFGFKAHRGKIRWLDVEDADGEPA